MTTAKGLPIVISAPSGAGKSTIASRVIKERPAAVLSISCTTRPPRPGEENGRDYTFISPEEFKRKIEAGEFLEWAVVHGHYYGTPLAALEEQMKNGKDIILNIDPQGALAVKRIYPQGVFIFVVPPSWAILKKRLSERAKDDPQSIELRLANARKELSYLSHYDYLVINNDLDGAVADVTSIIKAEHCRLTRLTKNDIPILS